MKQPQQKGNPAEIQAALRALLPLQIASACSEEYNPDRLLAEEQRYYSKIKSGGRARSFVAGRSAARIAIADISCSDQSLIDHPLLSGQSGNIVWPVSLCGSISHSSDIAVAAVARKTDYHSVGLDLEYHRDVNQSVVRRIARQSELSCFAEGIFSAQSAFFGIFSAKESIFKAINPLVGKYFGFQAAELIHVDACKRDSTNRLYDLRLRLTESLSSDFLINEVLPVRLFLGDYFTLTFCGIRA